MNAVAVLVAAAVVVVRRAPCRRVRVQSVPAGSFDPTDKPVPWFAAMRSCARDAIRGLSDPGLAGRLRCSILVFLNRSDRP